MSAPSCRTCFAGFLQLKYSHNQKWLVAARYIRAALKSILGIAIASVVATLYPASAGGGSEQSKNLKAPPSIRRLWPMMKPEEAAQRKAQASPNSAGSSMRPVGFSLAQGELFVRGAAVLLSRMGGAAAQPVRQEGAGEQVVGGDVVARDLTGEADDEAGEAGTGGRWTCRAAGWATSPRRR
jgi:hypothetical protein